MGDKIMTAGICKANNEKLFHDFYLETFEQNFILEKINDYVDDAIVILDGKKHIISASKKFQSWFNFNVIGESFIKIMNEITQLPNDFFREKTYFIKKGDEILEAHTEKFSINSDRYIVILKEITDKKEIKAQKDNFIATLTHDLKTPVRADILSLELLLKGHFGTLSPEQKEIIEEILNSNKFMMNMLDTLLAKYKYENDGVQLTKSIFNINEFVQNTANELKYLFEEKNIIYKFNLMKDNIEINGDKLELKRAFSNILTNAIKFNKENGFVEITTYMETDSICIKVEDTGIGMNQEKMAHIFDKYVSYAKRFRRLGTGLGLYVAKKIIEAHKGKIEVNSIQNEGSCFIIKLPI